MEATPPEAEANPTEASAGPPHPRAQARGRGQPAAVWRGGQLDKFFRAAITQDVLQQEVQTLRDEAGRWACEFEAAVSVSMELKEQVEMLQQDHEKMLNTPRVMECDGVDALVKELCRRKSEVGQLKKKVRLLQAALASRSGPTICDLQDAIRDKDAQVQRLHEILRAEHPAAVIGRDLEIERLRRVIMHASPGEAVAERRALASARAPASQSGSGDARPLPAAADQQAAWAAAECDDVEEGGDVAAVELILDADRSLEGATQHLCDAFKLQLVADVAAAVRVPPGLFAIGSLEYGSYRSRAVVVVSSPQEISGLHTGESESMERPQRGAMERPQLGATHIAKDLVLQAENETSALRELRPDIRGADIRYLSGPAEDMCPSRPNAAEIDGGQEVDQEAPRDDEEECAGWPRLHSLGGDGHSMHLFMSQQLQQLNRTASVLQTILDESKNSARAFRVSHFASGKRERQALTVTCDLLKTQVDDLRSQRDSLAKERDALKTLTAQCQGTNGQGHVGQHQAVAKSVGTVVVHNDLSRSEMLPRELEEIQTERDALKAERDALEIQLHAERAASIVERANFRKERAVLESDRAVLMSEHDTLSADRVNLWAEQDVLRAERDALKFENKKLKNEHQASKYAHAALQSSVKSIKDDMATLRADRDVLRILKEKAEVQACEAVAEADRFKKECKTLNAACHTLEEMLLEKTTQAEELAKELAQALDSQHANHLAQVLETKGSLERELTKLQNECSQSKLEILQHCDTIETSKAKVEQLERNMVELRQQQADHLDEIDTLKAMAERDKTNIGALVEQVEAGRKEQESEHAEREMERKREGEMRNHTEQERDELRDAVCRLEKEIAVLNHAIENDRQKARQRECAQDEAVAANMMLLENEIDRLRNEVEVVERMSKEREMNRNEVQRKVQEKNDEEREMLKSALQSLERASEANAEMHLKEMLALQADLAAAKEQTDVLKGNEAALQTQLKQSNESFIDARKEAEGREANLQEQLKRAFEAVDSNERDVEGWTKKYSTLQREHDLVHETQDGLRQQIAALQECVEQKVGTAQLVQLEIADLHSKLARAKEHAVSVNNELIAICSSMVTLQKEFDDAKIRSDERAEAADRRLEGERVKARVMQQDFDAAKAQWDSVLEIECRKTHAFQEACDTLKEQLKLRREEAEETQKQLRMTQDSLDRSVNECQGLSQQLAEAQKQEAKGNASSKSDEQIRSEHVNPDTAKVAVLPGQGAVIDEETAAGATSLEDASSLAQVDVVLDMDLSEIAGKEEDFRRAVIADVAAAVHGDPQKITILGLEAGSIVVKMQLAPGICGVGKDPQTVVRELEHQAEDPDSTLRKGTFTSKAKNVRPLARAPAYEHPRQQQRLEDDGATGPNATPRAPLDGNVFLGERGGEPRAGAGKSDMTTDFLKGVLSSPEGCSSGSARRHWRIEQTEEMERNVQELERQVDVLGRAEDEVTNLMARLSDMISREAEAKEALLVEKQAKIELDALVSQLTEQVHQSDLNLSESNEQLTRTMERNAALEDEIRQLKTQAKSEEKDTAGSLDDAMDGARRQHAAEKEMVRDGLTCDLEVMQQRESPLSAELTTLENEGKCAVEQMQAQPTADSQVVDRAALEEVDAPSTTRTVHNTLCIKCQDLRRQMTIKLTALQEAKIREMATLRVQLDLIHRELESFENEVSYITAKARMIEDEKDALEELLMDAKDQLQVRLPPVLQHFAQFSAAEKLDESATELQQHLLGLQEARAELDAAKAKAHAQLLALEELHGAESKSKMGEGRDVALEAELEDYKTRYKTLEDYKSSVVRERDAYRAALENKCLQPDDMVNVHGHEKSGAGACVDLHSCGSKGISPACQGVEPDQKSEEIVQILPENLAQWSHLPSVVTWAHTQRKSQRRTSANANQDLDWNPRILGAYEEHEQEGRHAGDGNHKRAADGGQTETAMREQLLSLRERERESRHDAETLREELLSAHLTLAQLQPQLQACVVQLQQLQTGGGADPDARCVTGQMRAQKDSEDTKQHSFQQKMSQQLTDLRETKGREMAALHAQMEAVLEHLECIEEEAVRAGYEQDARLEQAEVLKRELEACKATLAVVRLSSKEIRDLRAEEALEYEKKLSELGDEYQAAMRQHEERHKLAEAELCQMHAAVQLITEDMRSLSRRVEVPREGGEIGGGKLIYSSPLSHQNKESILHSPGGDEDLQAADFAEEQLLRDEQFALVKQFLVQQVQDNSNMQEVVMLLQQENQDRKRDLQSASAMIQELVSHVIGMHALATQLQMGLDEMDEDHQRHILLAQVHMQSLRIQREMPAACGAPELAARPIPTLPTGLQRSPHADAVSRTSSKTSTPREGTLRLLGGLNYTTAIITPRRQLEEQLRLQQKQKHGESSASIDTSSSPHSAANMTLILDMDFQEAGPEGSEQRARFESILVHDLSVAASVGTDNVAIKSLSPGSIVIEFAIFGTNRHPDAVAADLQHQAWEDASALRRGELTSRTIQLLACDSHTPTDACGHICFEHNVALHKMDDNNMKAGSSSKNARSVTIVRGDNGGLGLGFSRESVDIEEPYTITALVPGGAAESSGMLAIGERIVAADGTPVAPLRVEDVTALLRGSPNTPVTLTVVSAPPERQDGSTVGANVLPDGYTGGSFIATGGLAAQSNLWSKTQKPPSLADWRQSPPRSLSLQPQAQNPPMLAQNHPDERGGKRDRDLESIEVEAVRAGYEQDASPQLNRLEQAEVLKGELEACKATLAVVRQSSKEIRDLRAKEALDYEKKLSELGDEYQAAMRQHEERHKLAEAELCQMHAAVQLITEDMRSLSHRLQEGGDSELQEDSGSVKIQPAKAFVEIRDRRAEEALEYEKKLSELGDEYQAAMRQHEERHKLAEAELCQMHAAVQLITEDMRSLSHRLQEGGDSKLQDDAGSVKMQPAKAYVRLVDASLSALHAQLKTCAMQMHQLSAEGESYVGFARSQGQAGDQQEPKPLRRRPAMPGDAPPIAFALEQLSNAATSQFAKLRDEMADIDEQLEATAKSVQMLQEERERARDEITQARLFEVQQQEQIATLNMQNIELQRSLEQQAHVLDSMREELASTLDSNASLQVLLQQQCDETESIRYELSASQASALSLSLSFATPNPRPGSHHHHASPVLVDPSFSATQAQLGGDGSRASSAGTGHDEDLARQASENKKRLVPPPPPPRIRTPPRSPAGSVPSSTFLTGEDFPVPKEPTSEQPSSKDTRSVTIVRGDNGGLGLGFSRESVDIEEPYTITALVPGGAAESSGMLAIGERIVAADGTPVAPLRVEDVTALLRGSPNTPVTLTVVSVSPDHRQLKGCSYAGGSFVLSSKEQTQQLTGASAHTTHGLAGSLPLAITDLSREWHVTEVSHQMEGQEVSQEAGQLEELNDAEAVDTAHHLSRQLEREKNKASVWRTTVKELEAEQTVLLSVVEDLRQNMQIMTAVGLKHVSLRVLRAELKFAFMGWKDAWRDAVLDRLVDELENTGTFVQDERADDVGVEGSMPLRKNRPTLVVDHDSALAMQLRIAKDNLRKSPTATPPLLNPWSGPENVSERGDDGEADVPVVSGEDTGQEQQAWVGFLGGVDDDDEDRNEEGTERSWGAGLFGMVEHGRRDAGHD